MLTGVAAAGFTGMGLALEAPAAISLSLGAVAAGVIGLFTSRRSRQRFLDDAGIVRVTIDPAGTILEWSPAGAQVFGYRAAEVLGRNVSMLMPEPVASEHDGYLARFVHDRKRASRVLGARRQVVGRHRDGAEVPLLLFVQPIRRRGALAFEGLLQPIPAPGGQRLQPAQSDLAPQLAWRWLRNLGHEIRTPMAGIQGHAEILVDPVSTGDERRESADAILRNSRHLVELLNDLLDHARLSAGQMPVQLQRVDLHRLVADAAEMVRPNVLRKGLHLDLVGDANVGADIDTDPLRLRQILLNLLGNAIKFTHAGWVRIEVRRSGDGATQRLWIDVVDTGVGISSDFAQVLFQPFQQEPRAQSDVVGSGLGLSICRQLARLLGGDLLLIESLPGTGSRFRIDLPLAAGGNRPPVVIGPERGDAAAGAQQLEGLRVLVVDDAIDLLKVTARSLERAGAEVRAFATPAAALAHAANTSFDVALLDLMMPEISGFELATRLRLGGYDGPMLALSATGDADGEVQCANAGFDRLLRKPIRRTELVQAIADAAARCRGRN